MTIKPWKRALAERHLKAVARKNHIAVRWLKGRTWMERAEASETARMVHIPHPNNARQYLVALHELGHLLGAVKLNASHEYDATPHTFHLLCEASAWAWAMEHIHDDLAPAIPSPTVTALSGLSLSSHVTAVFHEVIA